MTELGELKKLLTNHETRISKLENLVQAKSPASLNGEKIIQNLIDSGFFDTKRRLSDITNELKTQAKFEKNGKYSEILVKLTRDDKLTRKMSGHQWWYVKNE